MTQIREPFAGAVDLEPTPIAYGGPRALHEGSGGWSWCNCAPSYACPEHR